jgi:putative transposase
VANPLFETVAFRNEQAIWFASLVLLMPDHVHFLVSFPGNGRRMRTSVSKWKEWTAKKLAIAWQRDFFEHRLRRDESARQKADYILFNPVRAGLVSRPEDWAFVFIPER